MMSENIDSRQPVPLRRRDILCATVGAVTAAAVTATAAGVVRRPLEKVPDGGMTEPALADAKLRLSETQRELDEANAREQKALAELADTESLVSQTQRELEEANAREQQALEGLAAAKKREASRSKAKEIIGAPVWTSAELNEFLVCLGRP